MQGKIQTILKELDPLTLYGAAQLAAEVFDPKTEREAYRQLKRRLNRITRDYRDDPFMDKGEDVIVFRGQQCPAWSGETWQTYLNRVVVGDSDEASADGNASAEGRTLFHPAMIVGSLENFEIYTRPQILDRSETKEIFADLLRRQVLNAEKYLSKLAAKLPEQADSTSEGGNHRIINGWFGYRWKLALSRNALDDDSRAALTRKVEEWETEQARSVEKETPFPTATETTVVTAPRRRFLTKYGQFAAVAGVVLGFLLGWYVLVASSDAEKHRRDLDRYKMSVQPDAVDQLEALWRRGDLAIPPEDVAKVICGKVDEMPELRHIPLLRDIYDQGLVNRNAIAAQIARLYTLNETRPVVVAESSRPMFAAAINERPVIIFPSGTLQPGDLAKVDGKMNGYVDEIGFAHFKLMASGSEWAFGLGPTDADWRPMKTFTISGWRGRFNFQSIMEFLSSVDGLELDGLPTRGHISGRMMFDSYPAFVDYLRELYDRYQSYNVAQSQDSQLFVHLEYGFDVHRPRSLKASLDWFSQQMGIPVEMDEVPSAELETEWVLVNPQWDRFLSEAGLTFRFETEDGREKIRVFPKIQMN